MSPPCRGLTPTRLGHADRVAAAGLGFLQRPHCARQQYGQRGAVPRVRNQAGADRNRQRVGRLELQFETGERHSYELDGGLELIDGLGWCDDEEFVRAVPTCHEVRR